MIELIATITLTAGSILLFCYWFRYTCFLILNAQTVREYAMNVAQANQLTFFETQTSLAGASPNLDRLKNAMDRDYAVITGLLNQLEAEQSGIEQRMLALHYRMMGVWYQASRHISAGSRVRPSKRCRRFWRILPTRSAKLRPHPPNRYFDGARRRSSSNQFSTTLIWFDCPGRAPCRTIKNRLPSAETS
jgi:hypothetical protein